MTFHWISDQKRIWVTRCPVPTATSIALDRGEFDRALSAQGWSAGELREGPDSPQPQAHYDHSLVTLLREGGNIPPLWARARGADTVLVGLTWVDEYQAILALPGSGLDSVASLAGRRVAVRRNASALIDAHAGTVLRGLHNGLATAGLSLADVGQVDVAPLAVEAAADSRVARVARQWKVDAFALLEGHVDAIFVKGASGVETLADIGAVELVETGFHDDPLLRVNNGTPRPLTVHGELLRNRPEIVENLLLATLRAADWARTDTGGLSRILTAETGTRGEGLGRAYRDVEIRPSLAPQRLAALENQRVFLRRAGFLPADFDIGDWVDPAPLDAALARHASSSTERKDHE